MTTYHREPTAAEAFRIADEAMRDLLLCHSLPGKAICIETGGVISPTNYHGKVVRTLAEAEEAVQESADWLIRRGLAVLLVSDDGTETILLKPVDRQ